MSALTLSPFTRGIFNSTRALLENMPGRYRSTDPAPSIRAAEAAPAFAGSHADRIVACLKLHGQRSTHEIAQIIGLSVVQIDRRKCELERAGRVRVVNESGKYSILEAV